jgi:hypothetical protein
MKLALVFAVTAATAVSFSTLAHADDVPFARAFFQSSATHAIVQNAACSFDASSTFDGRQHDFDVHVGGARCPNRALADGAIPLFVWLEHGDRDCVVVETAVPEGVDAHKLQTAIVAITTELQNRVMRASTVAVTTPPSYGWTAFDNDDYRPRQKRTSPGLMAGGILLIVAGSLATIGGAVSAASNTGYFGNPAPGLLVLVGGVAGLASGIPMLVIGSKKIPAVSASVSPIGGNLRVTF